MKAFITTVLQCIFTLLLYCFGVFIIGLAMYPGIVLCINAWLSGAHLTMAAQLLILSFSLAAAYFIYGLSLILIVAVLRFVFRLNLKEGDYPLVSWATVKWAVTNSLVLVVSVTFMDFILLTPLATVFYRLMGAKVGKNIQINSKYCADLSLLEIGDGAVIGGHATVICHSFERNRFILKKVKIGRRAIIGLNSVILPGTEIGDGALIAAGAVLGKNTLVKPREVFFGVPAESVRERREREKHE